jgi:hypothetical protein
MAYEYMVASCSWPDHLCFGENDGALSSIEHVKRRMDAWKETFNSKTVHWREVRTRRDLSKYYASPDNPRTQEKKIKDVTWDDFREVPRLAHERDMKALLYVSVFDEGRPLPQAEERSRSFHNSMHGQHVTWQTDWSRENPDFAMVNRGGDISQWGVLCYGYPEVREQIKKRILGFIDGNNFDGVFLCTRSQCRPADYSEQFGFNKPVRNDYYNLYGYKIEKEDFDLNKWHSLLGNYFTIFLRELSFNLHEKGLTLSIGIPRGDVIGPPLGNWDLQWRIWVEEGLIDELIIDQNSSKCPSMWHDLWPMHRGYGYAQNYITGKGLKPLEVDIKETYLPVFKQSRCKLVIARQWVEPDEREEDILLSLGVHGMVFSTFRFDNPEVIKKGDFIA